MRVIIFIAGVISLEADGFNQGFLDPSFEFYYENNNISIGQDSIGNFSGVLYNNSSNSITISMVRRENNLSESWTSSICIGSICFNESVDSASAVINVGDSTSCGVLVWTNGIGNGEVEIDLFDLDNPSENELVTINFNTAHTIVDPEYLFKENSTLISCYPNPFNPITTLKYKTIISDVVSVDIFNDRGRKVRNLFNKYQAEGYHQIQWNGKSDVGKLVGSGVYFFRIRLNNYITSKKVLLLK